MTNNKKFIPQVLDAAVGGSAATMGLVGDVAGAAHQAAMATVDQTQIITLQVRVRIFIKLSSVQVSLCKCHSSL